ncbi:hypothetical protein DFH06DRAFT_1340271 [Mycena polygramma]|nr:hypothetical protein DFH06DRAFT_1340271 [Mycena polygramma]
MEYPRAQVYQSTLHQFYARNAPSSTVRAARTRARVVPAPALNPRPATDVEFRHFVPGAGKASIPIDVDDWCSRPPIDVDAFDELTDGEAAGPLDGSDLPSTEGGVDVNEADTEGGVAMQVGEDQDPGEQSSAEAPASRDDKRLFSCCICTDTLNRPVITLCMHVFCDMCISTNFAYSTVCPLCRAEVSDAPMRDSMLEEELARAIERGDVEPSSVAGRRRPYTWGSLLFPQL